MAAKNTAAFGFDSPTKKPSRNKCVVGRTVPAASSTAARARRWRKACTPRYMR
jgi:hypothetical protein